MDETIVPATITPDADYAAELTGLFDLRGQTAFVPGGPGGLAEAPAAGRGRACVASGGRVEGSVWGRGRARASGVAPGRDRSEAEALAAEIAQTTRGPVA